MQMKRLTAFIRHCERSEATQSRAYGLWVDSLRTQ